MRLSQPSGVRQPSSQASSAWRRHRALVEDDAALGIDAGGDIGGGHLARLGAQLAPGPAAGSARADRRCRRCIRNRAAAPPSCGSRRDNCRDAGCRSAGRPRRCGSCALLSPRRRGRVKPVAGAAAGSRLAPVGDAREPAPARRRRRARRRPGRRAPRSASRSRPSKAGRQQRRRSSASTAAHAERRRSDARQIAPRARRSSRKCPRRTSTTSQQQRIDPARAGQSPARSRHGPETASAPMVSTTIDRHRRRPRS